MPPPEVEAGQINIVGGVIEDPYVVVEFCTGIVFAVQTIVSSLGANEGPVPTTPYRPPVKPMPNHPSFINVPLPPWVPGDGTYRKS